MTFEIIYVTKFLYALLLTLLVSPIASGSLLVTGIERRDKVVPSIGPTSYIVDYKVSFIRVPGPKDDEYIEAFNDRFGLMYGIFPNMGCYGTDHGLFPGVASAELCVPLPGRVTWKAAEEQWLKTYGTGPVVIGTTAFTPDPSGGCLMFGAQHSPLSWGGANC